jgi:hypothetical protein
MYNQAQWLKNYQKFTCMIDYDLGRRGTLSARRILLRETTFASDTIWDETFCGGHYFRGDTHLHWLIFFNFRVNYL